MMGIRQYCSETPSEKWRDSIMSLRTITSPGWTSSQIGTTVPSEVSVCSRSLSQARQQFVTKVR